MSLFFTILLQVTAAFSANPVLHFDPTTVELHGTLEVQTFPGPPNYESIKDGDRIERGWYLKLDHPVDVIVSNPATDSGWKTERNVTVIQMAIMNDDDWGKVKEGKRIIVKGKLFNRQTGHHHSRVLIEVENIKEPHK